MSESEILKLFNQGIDIDRLTEKFYKVLKNQQQARRAEKCKQLEYIKSQKKKDKKYKYDGVRVLVGGRISIQMARNHVETVLYKESMRGCEKP